MEDIKCFKCKKTLLVSFQFVGYKEELKVGYNEEHLDGFVVPLPSNPRTNNEIVVIKHPHLTILFNAKRRLAACSAFNYDGRNEDKRERRSEFHYDEKIGDGYQADNRFYANNPWDRGHLAAFNFLRWGRFAHVAGVGSFDWTNIAPQHTNMHTSNGREWTEMETYVKNIALSGRARDKLLSCFAGCVFRENDYKLKTGREGDFIFIPQWFWFVVYWVDKKRGKLKHMAFRVRNYIADETGNIINDNPTDSFSKEKNNCDLAWINEQTGFLFRA